MTTDAGSMRLTDEERESFRRMAAEQESQNAAVEARLTAERTLREIRDRIRGADDRHVELIERLRSGQPGELSAAEVALLADCIEAESLDLILADMRELDPFPAVGATMLEVPADMMPGFTERDLPRLRNLAQGMQ